MAEQKKDGFSTMNLTIVSVIALVAIVSVVALVLAGRPTPVPASFATGVMPVGADSAGSANLVGNARLRTTRTSSGGATRPLGSGVLATKYDNELLRQMADDAVYAVGRRNGNICSNNPESSDLFWVAVDTCEALMNDQTGNDCSGCRDACQDVVLAQWPRC